MKYIFLLAATMFGTIMLFAQAEISKDEHGNKVVKGFLNRKELATDSAFAWYARNSQGYTPESTALQAFKSHRDSVNILAFGGTWCDDTQHILPRFFMLTDAAGVSPDRITVLGVDHDKKTVQHLSEAFGVTRVPTFIVMKNGKEIGRVVEWGKTGMWDKELGEILTVKAK